MVAMVWWHGGVVAVGFNYGRVMFESRIITASRSRYIYVCVMLPW